MRPGTRMADGMLLALTTCKQQHQHQHGLIHDDVYHHKGSDLSSISLCVFTPLSGSARERVGMNEVATCVPPPSLNWGLSLSGLKLYSSWLPIAWYTGARHCFNGLHTLLNAVSVCGTLKSSPKIVCTCSSAGRDFAEALLVLQFARVYSLRTRGTVYLQDVTNPNIQQLRLPCPNLPEFCPSIRSPSDTAKSTPTEFHNSTAPFKWVKDSLHVFGP